MPGLPSPRLKLGLIKEILQKHRRWLHTSRNRLPHHAAALETTRTLLRRIGHEGNPIFPRWRVGLPDLRQGLVDCHLAVRFAVATVLLIPFRPREGRPPEEPVKLS